MAAARSFESAASFRASLGRAALGPLNRPLVGGPVYAYPVVGGKIACAVGVAPVDHHALAVLDCDPPDVGAHGRLVIERSVGDLAEGSIDVETFQRRDQLRGVG